MSAPLILSVPMPLRDIDAELNTMAMLEFVMRHAQSEITIDEQMRISTWFGGKYGKPETDRGES